MVLKLVWFMMLCKALKTVMKCTFKFKLTNFVLSTLFNSVSGE